MRVETQPNKRKGLPTTRMHWWVVFVFVVGFVGVGYMATAPDASLRSAHGQVVSYHLKGYAPIMGSPIYQSPWNHNAIADNGNAFLHVGDTFIGKQVENNHVWIAHGLGFVPAFAVAPYEELEAISDVAIYEAPSEQAPIALGGSGKVLVGERFRAVVVESNPQWVWIAHGAGFVPISHIKRADEHLPAYPYPYP